MPKPPPQGDKNEFAYQEMQADSRALHGGFAWAMLEYPRLALATSLTGIAIKDPDQHVYELQRRALRWAVEHHIPQTFGAADVTSLVQADAIVAPLAKRAEISLSWRCRSFGSVRSYGRPVCAHTSSERRR